MYELLTTVSFYFTSCLVGAPSENRRLPLRIAAVHSIIMCGTIIVDFVIRVKMKVNYRNFCVKYVFSRPNELQLYNFNH